METCTECGGRFDRPGLFKCTTGHPTPTVEQRIVAAIERDLRDRRGLRQEWEQIDDDIQQDIRDEWAKLVHGILEAR